MESIPYPEAAPPLNRIISAMQASTYAMAADASSLVPAADRSIEQTGRAVTQGTCDSDG